MKRILPAYPLWIIDPNFSVWSQNDTLNGGNTVFWTGLTRRTYGLVRFDGKTYCFLGQVDGAASLKQKDIEISAFSTDYVFESEKFTLSVKFVSPLLPNDLTLLSCPVCFTDYALRCNGDVPEDFSIAIAVDEEYCYGEQRAATVGGVLPTGDFETAFMTRERNLALSNANDCVAPDWGDVYLTGETCWFITSSALNRYISEGKAEYIRRFDERNYIMAVNHATAGTFLTGFDDRVSVFYFGEWLRGYYFRKGKTIIDALNESYCNHDSIINQCARFDDELRTDCEKVGAGYYTLACASLRQSVGAHKLVENAKGELLFLSKECNSNGCVGTVDISYPSMPLYLLYNPELVNAMTVGIYDFARMPVWTYDFAPHDIGRYPWCCGQVYGIKNVDDKYSCNMTDSGWELRTNTLLYLRPAASDVYDCERQMPVEECGNMLIMAAAAILAGADKALAEENFDLLKKWVRYVEKYGMKPKNQLCTDDFAGHLANNVNLAIKALVGIEAFSIICDRLDKNHLSEEYKKKASAFAAQLKEIVGGGVMPLAYGMSDSYSLKYNILFDKLFGFDLIGRDVRERETAYYIQKECVYGTPLDSRKSYTKSDWLLWVAAITDDKVKREALYKPVLHYLEQSPSRKPFGDWYDAETGIIEHFFNRTVQGGIFAPLLGASGILVNGRKSR